MKIIIGAIIGGVVGFGVGYFGKCIGGACPLTGNPYVTSGIGTMLGIMITAMK